MNPICLYLAPLNTRSAIPFPLQVPLIMIAVLIGLFFVVFTAGTIIVTLLRLFGLYRSPHLDEDKPETVLRGSRVNDAQPSPTTRVQQKPRDIHVGGVQITRQAEGQHILLAGSTGTGKSQGISHILSAIKARRSKALITDASGDYLSKFYKSGDLVFNPLDKRSVHWSPFAEIRNDFDCNLIAKAVIPDTHGDAAEWHHYAQSLLAEIMLKMHKEGVRSVKQLLYYINVADRAELEQLLEGMPAVTLCHEGNEKMLGSTRAIMASFLLGWRYLPDKGTFSIRQWIRDETKCNWLYITYKDDQFSILKMLISTLVDLSFVEGLSLDVNPDRDVWFVMDEIDSLGKVNNLTNGLSRFRKYGCKCILGIQTVSQLRATYGADYAQSVMANLGTKVILRAGDGETAEYFSKEIGDQETQRYQKSSGMSGGHASTNKTVIHDNHRTVLPSELMMLPDLEGYLKLPGPLTRIKLKYQAYPTIADAFIKQT